MRRVPEGQRIDVELLRAIKGRPWAPSDGETLAQVPIRNPENFERKVVYQEAPQGEEEPTMRLRRLRILPGDMDQHGYTIGM